MNKVSIPQGMHRDKTQSNRFFTDINKVFGTLSLNKACESKNIYSNLLVSASNVINWLYKKPLAFSFLLSKPNQSR